MEYVLCSKCKHQLDVQVELGKYSSLYICDGHKVGYFRVHDFWTIPRPCKRYEPADKEEDNGEH